MAPSVAWVFSLARSGSSIIAYAAAAGFECPVADEIFGPWDRTCEPYNYPAEQLLLVRAFARAGYALNAECIDLATGVFQRIAGAHDRVVSKYPHLVEPPGIFDAAFPNYPSILLLRNPLHRLNSMHARGMVGLSSEGYDLERYKAFAHQWKEHPNRMVYDDLRRDTLAFFRRVYEAWGWPATDAHVMRAATYTRLQYHSDSGVVEPGYAPPLPLSERERSLTAAMVDQYLGDSFIHELMDELGWSTDATDYVAAGAGSLGA